jgi:AraC-like DNA-binding protein
MLTTVRRWSTPVIIQVPLEQWLPRPIQAAGDNGSRGHDVVRVTKEWIERHLGDPIDVSEMARRVELSRPHFTEIFREVEGVPPWSYVMERRVRRAIELLDRDVPASEAAAEAGFCDQSHMTRVFKRVTGTTPGEYRRDPTNVQDEG